MLIQQETNEQIPGAPGRLRDLQNEDVRQHDTAHETLSMAVVKDIQAAQRGKLLQTLLFPVPFLLMAVTPFFITGATLAPFLWGVVGWLAVFIANNSSLRRIGRRLADIDDSRAVGALLDVLKSSGIFHGQGVEKALIRVLPRLKAGDGENLSREQRQFLYTLLTLDLKWYSANSLDWGVELKIATLKALEQIGDEEALPIVEQAAQQARNPRVRQAAQECLPFLRIRVEEQRFRQWLLRSSAAIVLPKETLLRPAVGGPETKAEELLRPSDKET
jgi:hypothetical protein